MSARASVLTACKLSRGDAERAFPRAETDVLTREIRNLPSADESMGNSRPGRRGPQPRRVLLLSLVIAAGLGGCATQAPSVKAPTVGPVEAHALLDRLVPRSIGDRGGWIADMYAAFTVQQIDPTPQNICAAVAVIEQESGFRTDPAVAGLPTIAWREIDQRAEHAGIPALLVHAALQLSSSSGRSYSDRIDGAKTEKDLSDIFDDFIGNVPMGRKLFGSLNPIHTRGPMQVNVEFAERYATLRPYPYPVKTSIADEVFTRRGSLYFGIGHLLGYPARYDKYLYRFADFNAGQYASRNAAFQNAINVASGIPLVPDGALLAHGADAKEAGSTELALRALGPQLDLSDAAIHTALEQARSKTFERTTLYQRVFTLAERTQRRPLPLASIPRIRLEGPKISRTLTTEWYATRVNERFSKCLEQA